MSSGLYCLLPRISEIKTSYGSAIFRATVLDNMKYLKDNEAFNGGNENTQLASSR